MNREFVSLITPLSPPPRGVWLIFNGYRLLVHLADEAASLPELAALAELGLVPLRQHYLGYVDRPEPIHCFTAEVAAETAAPAGMAFLGLRSLFGRLADEQLWLGGRAVQIIDWDRTHKYCSRCGAENALMPAERAKRCPACGLVTYPRLSPAVIVRVTRQGERGSEILLARGPRHPPGFYSVLAGFVEPGETLETAVHREIREEVGLTVKNVCYFGSQPWPFPNSLMIAYTAEYAGGELRLEEEEIEDAQWFTADTLPGIPPAMSISRSLIDDFVERARSL